VTRAHHPSYPCSLAKLLVACVLASPTAAVSAQEEQEPGGPGEGQAAATQAAPPARTEPDAQAATKLLKAIAFSDRFAEVIEHELKVQKYEQESLGSVDLESLAGKRLEYRLRIDRDTEEFLTQLKAVPTEPLALPRPSEAEHELSPRASDLIRRINRAYISDRDTRTLNFIFNANEKFLTTEAWNMRETAVKTRDVLMASEITYAELVATGRMLLNKDLSESELDDLEAVLDEISPETKTVDSGKVLQLLTDKVLQRDVLAELNATLTGHYDLQIPVETDKELLDSLEKLQNQLLEETGLDKTLLELQQIEVGLMAVETQLNDMGVDVLNKDDRRKAVQRRTILSQQRQKLHFAWSITPPPQPLASQLGMVQDALIRRRLQDLGARGALFIHRYDMLNPAEQLKHETARAVWKFLDAQTDLITSLDMARPAPNPLAGLMFTPQQPDGSNDLQSLLDDLPKPGKGTPGKNR